MSDLAVMGGEPAFPKKLFVGRPNVGDRARLFGRIADILDNEWLSNDGPYVREFERRIAEMVGVRHCVAVCNATTGLQIAAYACGLTGEVIVPSMTFVATAHALQWLGITPVFCDVDPETHNIDPWLVERLITPRTTAIMGVHLWGRPCDVEALERIAQRWNLKLLFDAAHAFGCSQHGVMIGNFGAAEVYSFHATKFVNTLEGGAIVTSDDDLAHRARLARNFGLAGHDEAVCAGTNGKMNEISAAMGLTTLECADDLVAANRRIYKCYQQGLAGIAGVSLVNYDESEKCNYQYVVLEVDGALTHVSRDDLLEVLHAENVLAKRYFYPGCHLVEPYRSSHRQEDLTMPETERLVRCVLALPTGPSVSPDAAGTVCEIIRTVVTHGLDVRSRLQARATQREPLLETACAEEAKWLDRSGCVAV